MSKDSKWVPTKELNDSHRRGQWITIACCEMEDEKIIPDSIELVRKIRWDNDEQAWINEQGFATTMSELFFGYGCFLQEDNG